MATRTEEKRSRLTADYNTKQLVFPANYASQHNTNAGQLVVFQINRISGANIQKKAVIKGLSNGSSIGFNNLYGTEVSMQGAAGNSSMRGKTDTALGAGAVYAPTDESIVLPFPGAWNISESVQWNSTEMGVAGRAQDFGNSLAEGNKQAVKDQAWDSFTRSVAGAIQSVGLPKIKDYYEMKSGYSENPYSEVLFRGANNRVIPLQWNLTPRNFKEAVILRNIIHRFRFHQKPELKYNQADSKNSSFIIAPSTFDIHFIDATDGTRITWVPKVATCALTNITVNGTPNGEYSITKDGQFTSVTLELNFLEMVLPMKDVMVDPDDSY